MIIKLAREIYTGLREKTGSKVAAIMLTPSFTLIGLIAIAGIKRDMRRVEREKQLERARIEARKESRNTE